MIAVPSGDKWRRRESGPVVRPYAVTGGRTEPADVETLDLLTVVVASGEPVAEEPGRLTPEHRRILGMCVEQVTVVDIAAETTLPVGVVRVLLADLIQQGAITVMRKRPAGQRSGNDVLQEILNGLRAL